MRVIESDSGISQTRKKIYYQVKDYPIKILDLPGFENKEALINSRRIKEIKKKARKNER